MARKQCIYAIIQALQCFKLRLTPIDVVLEVISSKEYDQVKNDMLEPQNVSKLLESLALCKTSRDVVQRFIERQALGVALQQTKAEMESIVARIGDQFRHPILLGHAVIRSEPTVAPFLRAILNQVNESVMSGQQEAETNVEVIDRYPDFEEVADSDISAADAVEFMLFNRENVEKASPTSSTICNEPVGLAQYAARLTDSVLHKKGMEGSFSENVQPDEQSAFPVSAISCDADFARTRNERIVSQSEVIIDHRLQAS
ncbi:hypothetical protein A7U60_g2038 [Sanghuangporus baumii]|uniref:Uncharacterized protein n=1 Tax=Sanghuangporus baumii TaxID=108892 RepID=A0A9Q5NE84_SANBA|nr:hypothetical protein A7U60_g2038 [Sanghuangporus baumii]